MPTGRMNLSFLFLKGNGNWVLMCQEKRMETGEVLKWVNIER